MLLRRSRNTEAGEEMRARGWAATALAAVALAWAGAGYLAVANDRGYLGEKVNGPLANALGLVYLVIIVAAAVAAVPIMIFTGMGG
jgi:hypothetical protein